MVDHKRTYQEEADLYELLVSREDHQGNILREVLAITPVNGMRVIDLGTGTGRLVGILRPFAKAIVAMDMAFPMLRVAREKLGQASDRNWHLAAADHRRIPLTSAWADIVISGWSVCYLADWYPRTWKKELDTALEEIDRVLKPGGTIILIETQGTGFVVPHPPPHLDGYFRYLGEHGFTSSWIRTDYNFDNLEQAAATTSAFFGQEFGQTVRQYRWKVVPECTGFWWRMKLTG